MTTVKTQTYQPTATLDISAMPSNLVFEDQGIATPLAMNEKNQPIIVMLTLKAGSKANNAHATSDGRVRFLTVVKGTLYYADGNEVDPTKEVAYPAGSILLIASGTNHWVASHDGDVTFILTAVEKENLAPYVTAQQNAAQNNS